MQVQVQVQTSDGASACGELREAPHPGTLRLVADAQPVDVALDALSRVSPADGC